MAVYPRDGQGEVQSLFCASFSGAGAFGPLMSSP